MPSGVAIAKKIRSEDEHKVKEEDENDIPETGQKIRREECAFIHSAILI
jgi:hypothetical protein